MERIGQVTKSASALVVAKLVTSSLFFLLAIVVNRSLGPQKAGVYVYAMALYMIFQVIPDFGLGNILIRDVSPDRSKLREYLRNIVSMRIGLGFLSFALLMLANIASTLLQHSDPLAGQRFWVTFVIAFSLLMEQPFSNSLAEAFISLERQMAVAYVYLIMGFLRVALSLYIVLSGAPHALVLLVATYLVTILYSIFHFYVLYRRALKRLSPVSSDGTSATAVSPVLEKDAVQSVAKPLDFNLWRYLLRAAWPLAVVAAGVVVYAGLDIPLIAWIKGDKAVGLYNAGAMYYKAVTFLLIAINMAILPAISIVADKHPERLGEIWERLLRYVLILVIPLSVVVPVLACPFLIMQKHDYIQVWNVVWITMAAVNFTILTTISYLFFIVIDKQKKIVQVVLIGLAFKTGLNVFLISIWGYTGAAITVLVTEFLAFALVYYLLSRELKHKISLVRLAGVPAVALAALYALAFLFQKLLISGKAFNHAALGTIPYALLITVIIVLIYGAVALSARTVTRAGIAELNELLKVE